MQLARLRMVGDWMGRYELRSSAGSRRDAEWYIRSIVYSFYGELRPLARTVRAALWVLHMHEGGLTGFSDLLRIVFAYFR